MRALVLGGARSLHKDAEAALRLFRPDVLIATNHAGREWPEPFDHWVSYHVEKFPRWTAEREKRGHPGGYRLWCPKTAAKVLEGVGRLENWGGSSGLLAAGPLALIVLGCERVVLAGVPLDARGAHFDDPRPWTVAKNYQSAWTRHYPTLRDRVRSMSGWTMELLGAPTEDWLCDTSPLPPLCLPDARSSTESP